MVSVVTVAHAEGVLLLRVAVPPILARKESDQCPQVRPWTAKLHNYMRLQWKDQKAVCVVGY